MLFKTGIAVAVLRSQPHRHHTEHQPRAPGLLRERLDHLLGVRLPDHQPDRAERQKAHDPRVARARRADERGPGPTGHHRSGTSGQRFRARRAHEGRAEHSPQEVRASGAEGEANAGERPGTSDANISNHCYLVNFY